MLPVMPSLRLDHRRAIVTGASRGPGSATANALAEAGAHVILAARDDAALSAAVAELSGRGLSPYSASEHAMEGCTKGLALERGPHGIRVNTICPIFIVTDLTRSFFEDPEFRAGMLHKIAFHRLGDAADVTGAVVFLASEASALMLDGGWTAA